MAYSDYTRAVFLDLPVAFYPLAVADFGRQIAASISGPILNTIDGAPLVSRTGIMPVPMSGCPPVLDLDGTESIYSSDTFNLNTTEATIEAWVLFPSTPGADVYIFDIAATGNPLHLGLRYFSSNFEFFVGDTVGGAYLLAQFPFAPSLGRWVHVVGSTDGSRADMWVDSVPGVSDTTTSGTRAGTAARAFVGRYNGSFTFRPTCSVALAALYPRYDRSLAGRHFSAARRAHGLGRRRRRMAA